MTTLAIALKNEIRRLARKEIKAHIGPTAQAVAQFRREIAKLKRQSREYERKIAFLEAQERKRNGKPEPNYGADESLRFSSRSVKAQRRRTGLSAADYAKLVGVSGLTIYNWENGKSRPRKEQLASLIAVRGLGKRQAQVKLELLNAAGQKASRKTRTVRRKAG
jgi:DNA-binding transcriptional regulator YiaG